MHRITLPTLALLTAVALTACGTTDTGASGENTTASEQPAESSSPTEATTYPAGEYTVTDPDSGAELTLTIPAEGNPEADQLDPAVEPLAAHLGMAGAPAQDFQYVTVDVDNRQGTTTADPALVWATDAEGNTYNFVKDEDIIDTYAPRMEWPDDVEDPYYTLWDGTEISEDQYDSLNSDSVDAYNNALNGVNPGARETIVFTYDGSAGPLPEEFTVIAVDGSSTSNMVTDPGSTPSN